jgi:transposase
VGQAGAAHTRDFEDVVAWLAQQMARTPVCGLLRGSWATVGRIVTRVVAEHLDERRLQGLACIGVDEISYVSRGGALVLTAHADRDRADRILARPELIEERLQRWRCCGSVSTTRSRPCGGRPRWSDRGDGGNV